MNLKQLKALNLVAKTGSISNAARVMNVSQPAVSKMIRSLEREIGIPILNHTRGKVQLHPELSAILPSIERITDEASVLKATAQEMRAGNGGGLVISCSTTVAMSLVLPAWSNLLAKKPGFRAMLIARGGRFSIDDIMSNRAHLAVEQLDGSKPTLRSRPLSKGRMVCVLPRGHGLRRKRVLRLNDLNGQRIVLYPPKTLNGGRMHTALKDAGVVFHPIFMTDSAVLACEVVRKLGVIGIVDSYLDFSRLYPDLQVKPMAPEVGYDLHAMWKPRSMSSNLDALLEEMAIVGKRLT